MKRLIKREFLSRAGRIGLWRCLCVCSLILTILLGVAIVPEPVAAASAPKYYIKINRQQNCVTIYEKDSSGSYTIPVKAMVCSVGVNNTTPTGVFQMGGKYRWHELMGEVYGQYCSRITGRVLFHSVYYSEKDPSTLSYNSYNRLGSAASHGCVRLCVADAKWIYDNCPSGTIVEIYDSSNPGPLGKPTPIRIDTSSSNRGWDPTDPDPNNPWPHEGPKLKGVKNRTIERCSSKSKLTKGVSATDFSGKKLKVKLSGKYNLNKVGKYKVTYSAVDSSGLSVKKTVTITVKDTTKPKVKIEENEIELTDESWDFSELEELKTYLKGFVTATDSKDTLADKYIHMTVGHLWNAWENSEYGTYTIKVYAKDKAGNRSAVKKISVLYRDTTAPTITAQPFVELAEEQLAFSSLEELEGYLRQYVKAEDNGEVLSSDSIHLSAELLWAAWQSQAYGIYDVTVYAVDDFGISSETITFQVNYVFYPSKQL